MLSFAQTATIKIDVDRAIGEIDPKIYGVFMEPIHFNGARMGLSDTVDFNTMYGNLYDPSSPLANEDGFRKDYIDALKELRVTNMRWPGGNFLMGYDWKDGIGPKDQRPVRINLAWGGKDNNHVGTDEWMKLNKAIGSENVVAVNLGLGSVLDAAYLVEYCYYKGGSYYSDLRGKNGHPQPYNVKIWDLGENANTHTLIPEDDIPVRTVSVANDGTMLVAGNNKVAFYRRGGGTDGRGEFMSGRCRITGIPR